MIRNRLFVLVSALLALTVLPLAAQDMPKVRVQLKWVTQAQFAGFYAAAAMGYWTDEGLDVEILPGGPDIGPQQVVAAGGAEFGIDWMGSMLASREQGTKAVNIAQIFQRSGMRQLTWKDSGIETFADLAGTVTGVWGFGNQYPLFAALVKNGIDPDNPDDITIFNQPFDMVAFLNREIDSAAAMTYNEMAQVFEFVAEDGTFPVYTLDDVNVLDLNEEGTAMLEDLVFVNEDWLAGEGNEEIAVKFLRGTFRGWTYCRDNVEACVDFVLAEGSTLGKGHQLWMMNEINKLVWPSPEGIGILNADLYQQTADIALNYEVITAAPDEGAVRTDLAMAALEGIMADYADWDFMGMEYEPIEVAITPNGE